MDRRIEDPCMKPLPLSSPTPSIALSTLSTLLTPKRIQTKCPEKSTQPRLSIGRPRYIR